MISVMWKWNPGIISRFFLEDIHIICGYTRGYRIKQQKISEKEVVYFQPEDNHETIAESQKLKNSGSNTSWKVLFFLISYAKQRRLKR